LFFEIEIEFEAKSEVEVKVACPSELLRKSEDEIQHLLI